MLNKSCRNNGLLNCEIIAEAYCYEVLVPLHFIYVLKHVQYSHIAVKPYHPLLEVNSAPEVPVYIKTVKVVLLYVYIYRLAGFFSVKLSG